MKANPSTPRKISLLAMLVIVWLLMSGHYNPLTLSLGLLSIVITFWASVKIGVVDAEGHPFELALRSPRYASWLLLEIFHSNVAVVKQILRSLRSGEASAGIQHFDTTGLSDLGQVIYANSITLTPGTLTIDISDDCLVVHALNKQSLSDMQDGSMYFRVATLIGATPHDLLEPGDMTLDTPRGSGKP